MIRECNCEEQQKCVDEMKGQVQQCFDDCWGKVASNPEELKQCYVKKEYVVEDMLTCLQTNIESCVEGGERKMIPQADIREIINNGEQKIQSTAQIFMKTFTGGKELLQTAVDVGSCMKDCFMQKNAKSFCFDEHKCQPLIEPREANKEIKKCLRHIEWKKEAGELCQCSEKAGVENIGDFCKMLERMGSVVQHQH
uniref:Uncharacterized protein n=1 Tax=Acrobeloides nanus TaxID=290746 RepID=A0A914BYZ3_9BILA